MYHSGAWGHTQIFDRRSIRVFLKRVGFEVSSIENSSHGVRCMTKHISGSLPGILKKLLMLGAYG